MLGVKMEAFTIRSGEKPSTERYEALLADYEEMASKRGYERVLALLERWREKNKFLPTKDQLAELDRQDSPVDLGGFRPTRQQVECSECGGSGWKSAAKVVEKNRKVTRCGCRTQAAKL
jgi:hypothetical protein